MPLHAMSEVREMAARVGVGPVLAAARRAGYSRLQNRLQARLLLLLLLLAFLVVALGEKVRPRL